MSGKRPWERLPDESLKAYEAFREYLELGPERTLAGGNTPRTDGLQGLGKSAPKIASQKKLSAQFGWQKRAAAYDAWVDEEYARAHVLAVQESAKRWAAREEATREKLFLAAEAMMQVAREMLDFKLAEREPKPSGAGGYIVTPTKKWTMSSACKLLTSGMLLARAAIRNENAVFDELGEDLAELLGPTSRLQ